MWFQSTRQCAHEIPFTLFCQQQVTWFNEVIFKSKVLFLLSKDNVSVSLDKWHCGNEHNSVLSQLEIRECGGSPQGHQSCLCVFICVCFIRVCLKLVARDTPRDRCFLLLSFFQLLITLSQYTYLNLVFNVWCSFIVLKFWTKIILLSQKLGYLGVRLWLFKESQFFSERKELNFSMVLSARQFLSVLQSVWQHKAFLMLGLQSS